jgi:ABC-type transporter Mla MlaB component
MLRISDAGPSDDATTLRLEGEVIGPWIAELQKVCEQFLGDGHMITLDLCGVSFIDRKALALFRELTHRRVKLINCSPFLIEQLREVGARCA